MLNKIIFIIVLILLAAMSWLAWRNSKPLNCAQLETRNGFWVCTVYIKQ